jgi:AcrR family transcriptional regulator
MHSPNDPSEPETPVSDSPEVGVDAVTGEGFDENSPAAVTTPEQAQPTGEPDPPAEADTTGEGGLRERKKRETRQRISDVATGLFITRGYDEVKISEIAEAANVSEKTVYNYFPTKEALVFDRADDQRKQLTAAVRERDPETSAVAAFTRALKLMLADMFSEITEDSAITVLSFGEMVRSTPALQAAAGEHRHRIVDDLTQILAANYRIDPREAEIVTAARGIVSLLELSFDSNFRHVEDGLIGDDLKRAVEEDLDRGARLVATGLWSLQVLVDERRGSGERGRENDFDAEQVREQVKSALRDAKDAWREFSEEAVAAGREIHAEALSTQNGDYSYVKDLARQRAQELKERARQIGELQKQAARDAAREAQREAREAQRAHREAQREAHRAQQEAHRQARELQREAHRNRHPPQS